MPAPTTNKTSHFNASDNDHLWLAYQGTTPFHNGVPADTNEVAVWDDEDARDLSFIFATDEPQYRTGVMALPALEFNGAGDSMKGWNHAASTATAFTTFFGASAFVAGMAFRIVSGATNDATVYLNDAIVADDGGVWGIFIKNNAGAYSLAFYNFDGSVTSFAISGLSVGVDYVVINWHTGGTLFAEVYAASGLVGSGSVASGATSPVTGAFILGNNYNHSQFANAYIGELVTYNAYVAGDKAALVTYLQGKWLGGGGGGPGLPTLTAITPNLAYANASVPVKLTGVAFTGTGLDGTGGAFDPVSGFTFSGQSIASGGASGTVDITIAAAKAPGGLQLHLLDRRGFLHRNIDAPLVFTIGNPTGGTSGDTGGNVRFNAGFN